MSARIESKTCGCALRLINNRRLKSDFALYFRNWPCDGLRAMRKYMSFVFHLSRFERLSKRLWIIYTRESGAASSSGGIFARRTPRFWLTFAVGRGTFQWKLSCRGVGKIRDGNPFGWIKVRERSKDQLENSTSRSANGSWSSAPWWCLFIADFVIEYEIYVKCKEIYYTRVLLSFALLSSDSLCPNARGRNRF